MSELPENVREAINGLDHMWFGRLTPEAAMLGFTRPIEASYWKNIRAELLRLARENADLREQLDYAGRLYDTAQAERERAESELAALRKTIAEAPFAEVRNLTGNRWSFRSWNIMPGEWREGVSVALVRLDAEIRALLDAKDKAE